MEEEDLYLVLGLEAGGPQVPQAVIRKAYRTRALECHPDKRGDDPVAAVEFQKLQRAYEVLSDEKARAAFDELQRMRRERAQKESRHSEKRQKMMRDLKERERAHEVEQKAKADEELAARRLKEEMARIRKLRAQRQGKEPPSSDLGKFARVQASDSQATTPSGASDADKTIKASWACLEGGGGGYSATRLREIFGEFGDVEDVVIRQGKSRRKSSALVVMGSKEAAVAATQRACGDLSNPLLVVPAMPLGGASGPGIFQQSRPMAMPVPVVKLANPVVGAGYSTYEDDTLEKMRHAAEQARKRKEREAP